MDEQGFSCLGKIPIMGKIFFQRIEEFIRVFMGEDRTEGLQQERLQVGKILQLQKQSIH